MFHSCATGIYPTHDMCMTTCVLQVYIPYMYYMCRNTDVTHV